MKLGWWIALGIVAVALIFQLFFRYQYFSEGYGLYRIDRLTGQGCRFPNQCYPPPAPTPTPVSTPTFDPSSAREVRPIIHTGLPPIPTPTALQTDPFRCNLTAAEVRQLQGIVHAGVVLTPAEAQKLAPCVTPAPNDIYATHQP